jgi:signal transduction histidine kinase
MDQQALPGQRLPCCLNDLITDLVEECEDLASAANVRLTKDVRVQQPLYVTGDVQQLYRLVSNLIVNAIAYTPAGGQVSVILDRSHDQALIQVQDTGIGIAPEDHNRIFERFYRVSGDHSRSTGGSGLGLAIATAITQAHHGNLQLQSELGSGSTFTLQLPLRR